MNQEFKKSIDYVFKNNESVDSVLVAADGNVFINDRKGSSFCKSHCKDHDLKFDEVSREDFYNQSSTGSNTATAEKPLSKYNKTELIAKCAELGITVDPKTENKKIVVLIEEKIAALKEESEKEQGNESGEGEPAGEESEEAAGEENESDNTEE